jgi:aryl-alcohol dehydrogenase-like predicted oxidoreductase
MGYGGSHLRGPPEDRPITEDECDRLLNAVIDAGINFIDTARAYGISEERIGRHLSHRRSEFYLATKCGGGQLDKSSIVASLDTSLRNLRTDYVDILQFHNSPTREALEQTNAIETMRDLQRQGKIRFIGVSGTIPQLQGQIEMGVFDTFQVPYSALRYDHEELLQQAAAAGAGIIIRNGVGSGDPDREGSPYSEAWQKAKMDEVVGDMEPLAFLLRYVYSNPDCHTTIVGTLSVEHLEDNIRALLKGPLPPEVYEEASRRARTIEPVGSLAYMRRGGT